MQNWQRAGLFVFGVLGIVLVLILVLYATDLRNPGTLQQKVILLVLAIACASVASLLPGTLRLTKPGIQASGAIAVFVFVVLYTRPSSNRGPEPFRFSIEFQHSPFHITLRGDGYHLGFTNVATWKVPKTLAEKPVRINSVQVDMNTIKGNGPNFCCDVWIFLAGDKSFTNYQRGGSFTLTEMPTPSNIRFGSPVQVRVVSGSVGYPGTEAHVNVIYHFDSDDSRGAPLSNLKLPTFSRPFTPQGAIFAQILVWTGDSNVDLDVDTIHLDVEGEVLPYNAN